MTGPEDDDDDTLAQITRVIEVWERLRPHKKFAGYTLEQFKKAVQPSIDAHAEVAYLERELERLKAEAGVAGAQRPKIH
jgi:hypothetical protein